jgi:hypothetical protein
MFVLLSSRAKQSSGILLERLPICSQRVRVKPRCYLGLTENTFKSVLNYVITHAVIYVFIDALRTDMYAARVHTVSASP